METKKTWDVLMVHSICLKVLGALGPAQIRILLKSLRQYQDRQAAGKLLYAYIQFSIELRDNPRKYDSFDAICSAIYLRLILKSMDDYNFTDMYQALFKYPERYYRFSRREMPISPREIEEMWLRNDNRPYAIDESPQRRLWENVLLAWNADASVVGRDSMQEREMLALLWECLGPDERAAAAGQLTEVEKRWIVDAGQEDECESLTFDGPNSLYDRIAHYRKKNHISSADLFEILDIDPYGHTFSNWKKEWRACEARGFQMVPKKARLSRKNIVDLALAFHLSVPEAWELMMMAGFIFTDDDEDILLELDRRCK